MLPTPHTMYRYVEFHHRELRAEFYRLRQGEKSPTRLTLTRRSTWDDLRHWAARWRPNVRWLRRWRWSSP